MRVSPLHMAIWTLKPVAVKILLEKGFSAASYGGFDMDQNFPGLATKKKLQGSSALEVSALCPATPHHPAHIYLFFFPSQVCRALAASDVMSRDSPISKVDREMLLRAITMLLESEK